MVADAALGSVERIALERYVRSMEHWMSAVLHWHRETRRYDEAMLYTACGLGRVLHARRSSTGLLGAQLPSERRGS